jgi:dihydroflavonol-4-reductase
MKRIVVTGANGFLGSWVTRALVEEGHDVVAVVRKNSDISELSGVSCKFVHGDVTDLSSLLDCFHGADSVFHLAGVIAYKKAQRQLMENVNVTGTKNVIEACQKNKVRRLVYLSSVVAIGAGKTKNEVLTEVSHFNLAHLDLGYFETKRQAEELVVEACSQKLLDAVILNPSTIYGGGDAKKGSRRMQVKVAQGKFNYFPSGGVNVVAIEDVVAGILSAWKIGRTGERYILAGENILIKDLFALIAAEASVDAPAVEIPDFVLHSIGIIGDLMDSIGLRGPLSRENAYTATMFHWFNATKAKKELGFKARPAKEAIHNSVQWMKENKLI